MEHLERLTARMAEIRHLGSVGAMLEWDQQCYMPHGGARVRAEQLSMVSRLAHEMFVGNETRHLLEAAEKEASHAETESDAALTVRVVRRDFDKSVKIPTSLIAEMSRTTAQAHTIWVKARQNDDFARFAPTLEKLIDLSRQIADALGYPEGGERYDALLDNFEPGMTTQEVTRVFDDLRPSLIALVHDIAQADPIADDVLRRDYDPEKQRTFTEHIARELGFDFERGRQDIAAHPFCTSFGRDDVRITTRFETNWLPSALMGTIHETGHGLYEQGFVPTDDDTPLAAATGLGVHESQSRLWENIIGRSGAFWNVHYGSLQKHFAGVLDDVPQEVFYRAINRVTPSLIRVEADEVTYNLHIMLRFELERALINGSLAVADLPAAWNQKMEEYLGITPPNDADGCLQDVHWSGGMFGYFPTYSLGTLLSAQLYEKALADNPAIVSDLAQGQYGSLLHWLRTNIHQAGRRYLPGELVQRVCGEPAQSRSYRNYLNTKFRTLYNIA